MTTATLSLASGVAKVGDLLFDAVFKHGEIRLLQIADDLATLLVDDDRLDVDEVRRDFNDFRLLRLVDDILRRRFILLLLARRRLLAGSLILLLRSVSGLRRDCASATWLSEAWPKMTRKATARARPRRWLREFFMVLQTS
jgi:hypothetical protein